MTSRDYEVELQSEQAYVTELYTRLDAERARVKGSYRAALRGPIDIQNGGTLVERDAEVRALAREAKRLAVADNGLCFGRLDALSGDRSYIGRIGIFDKENEYEPLLLDWRAPAARAFYVATAASPENMRRRRQFHTRGRRLVDFTDEILGRPDGAQRVDGASPRTRHCSPRSTRHGVTVCATSSRRFRPNRTRSSGWIIPGCS